MSYSDNSVDLHRPLVIAHRGASGLAPENTLAAFSLAIAQGAQGIELDVQLSADRQPVVIHDIRLNRTTNGRGFVTDLTAKELSRLDAGSWFERRIALKPRTRILVERAKVLSANNGIVSERVPALKEALALMATAGLTRIYIELKSKPSNRKTLAESVLSLVREFKLERSTTILSFDHEVVKLAKEIDPHIRTAATFSVSGRALMTPRSIARAAGNANADEAALHFGLATRRTVAALKETGFAVSAWTANRQIIMRRLIASGVDAIMTNFPDRLIDVIKMPDEGSVRARSRLNVQ